MRFEKKWKSERIIDVFIYFLGGYDTISWISVNSLRRTEMTIDQGVKHVPIFGPHGRRYESEFHTDVVRMNLHDISPHRAAAVKQIHARDTTLNSFSFSFSLPTYKKNKLSKMDFIRCSTPVIFVLCKRDRRCVIDSGLLISQTETVH